MAAGALTWESAAGGWPARYRAARTSSVADRLAGRADRHFGYRPIPDPVLRRHGAGSKPMTALRRDRTFRTRASLGEVEGRVNVAFSGQRRCKALSLRAPVPPDRYSIT